MPAFSIDRAAGSFARGRASIAKAKCPPGAANKVEVSVVGGKGATFPAMCEVAAPVHDKCSVKLVTPLLEAATDGGEMPVSVETGTGSAAELSASTSDFVSAIVELANDNCSANPAGPSPEEERDETGSNDRVMSPEAGVSSTADYNAFPKP